MCTRAKVVNPLTEEAGKGEGEGDGEEPEYTISMINFCNPPMSRSKIQNKVIFKS